MNKIVIVGHPDSGYQEVEALLNACGMAKAQPSRREGFMPAEINAILNKTHAQGAKPQALQLLGADKAIKQIAPSPVWQGMAMDLMLGNLEQPLWGWADPQAISLLNYWRDLDPQITFMLVYGQPHSVLSHMDVEEAAELSTESLNQRLDDWAAYNAALLHFAYRNQDRCLLVNSQQVRESISSYLKQVRARVEAPWSEQMEQLLAIESEGANTEKTSWSLEKEGEEAGSKAKQIAEQDLLEEEAALITDQPSQTVEALAHTLALSMITQRESTALPDNVLALFVADALVQAHANSVQLYEELQAVAHLPLVDAENSQPDPLSAFRDMARQQQSLHETEKLVKQKEELLARLTQAREKAEELAQEQLMFVKEQLAAQKEHNQRSEQRKQELEAQAALLKQAQEEGQSENELLIEQLHHVQEELERHYLENKQQAEQLQTVRKAEKDATDRINKLKGEHAKALQQLDALNTEKANLAAATTSAPIATELEQENDMLLTQLHHVQEELERFYLENQSLKRQAKQNAEPVYYGAADRVKAQLSYRLGARMILCSRSFKGWLSMPFALQKEVRLFRKEAAIRATKKLPPLSKYRDAYEAENVKRHLSYRLGQTLLINVKSPVGWVKLPWALQREINDFQARRTAPI